MPERFLDVSHEALIRGWPRLRRWLDEDRAGLRLQRRITETAEEWQRSNRDNDLLYRGARLIQAQEWRERHEVELNPLEREFLDASIVLKQRLEEEKRLHEAESKRADAERARAEAITGARRRERIAAIFASMVLIGLLLVSTFYLWNLYVEKRLRVERGMIFRDRAVGELKVTSHPTRKVTALQNLSNALRNHPKDTEAAALAAQLLMKNTWCPPLSSDVGYGKDALLAAAFAPGSENEVVLVSGDGELLRWKKGQSQFGSLQHLFDKPAPYPGKLLRDGVALFSTDAQWLFVLMPTGVASEHGGYPSAKPATQGIAPYAPASADRDSAKIRLWAWSPKSGTYEQAGSDVDLPLMLPWRTTLTWNERAQHVIVINVRGIQAECHVFRIARDGASELREISELLTGRNVVAAGASPDADVLAIGSVDGSVALVSPEDYQAIGKKSDDRATFQMPNGFQPIGINFGPAENELTLSSLTGMRTLNMASGETRPFRPPTFRDKLIRRVISFGTPTQRLVATALYGRVEVAHTARVDAPAEPIVLRCGTVAVPQFSRNGTRLLTLSGGVQNALDTLRVSDVSMLNDSRPTPVANFKNTPGPIWLADLAAAVSAFDAANDGSLLTLEQVREKYEKAKAAGPYDIVWQRFFPEEKSNGRLETGR